VNGEVWWAPRVVENAPEPPDALTYEEGVGWKFGWAEGWNAASRAYFAELRDIEAGTGDASRTFRLGRRDGG
jgi:hypothetical protein